MNKTITKILKISKGVIQLFCSIDKGFRKLESDTALIKEFRYLCYHANEKMEVSYCELVRIKKIYFDDQDNLVDLEGGKLISKNLDNMLLILEENIETISDYINDYSAVWKKTFSINALNKFESLIITEYHLLQQEINKYKSYLIYEERKNILKASTSKKLEQESNLQDKPDY